MRCTRGETRWRRLLVTVRFVLLEAALPDEVFALDDLCAEVLEAWDWCACAGKPQPSEPVRHPAISQEPDVRENNTALYYRLKLAPISEMSSSARLRTSSACR
jgi:hypothetical protein